MVFVCFYLVVDGVIFWQQKIKQRRNAVRAIASIPSTTEHSPGKPELDGSKLGRCELDADNNCEDSCLEADGHVRLITNWELR